MLNGFRSSASLVSIDDLSAAWCTVALNLKIVATMRVVTIHMTPEWLEKTIGRCKNLRVQVKVANRIAG